MTPREWADEHATAFITTDDAISRLRLRFDMVLALLPCDNWPLFERALIRLYDDVQAVTDAVDALPLLPLESDPCPTNSKPGSTTGAGSNST